MSANSSNPVVDRDVLLDRCMGEVDFALELLSLFLDNAPPLMEAITESTAAHDTDKVRQSAHSLRGIAMNVAALALANELQRLEATIADGQADLARLRDVYFNTLGAVWQCTQTLDSEPPATNGAAASFSPK